METIVGEMKVSFIYRMTVVCCLLLFPLSGFSFDVTVNSSLPTSGTNYSSINEALQAISGGTLLLTADTSTILFTDTAAAVTFLLNTDITVAESEGVVVFRGQQTNPDKFPVLNHTGGNWYHFMSRTDILFERVTFTGMEQFRSGQSDKRHHFKKCVIRNFVDSADCFYFLEGGTVSTLVFENCLFANNNFASEAIQVLTWNNIAPEITVVNCTFHNSGNLFSINNDFQPTGTTVFNCLFSENDTVSSGETDIRPRISYSFTQEDVSTYGLNCRTGDPLYQVVATKTIPSDFTLSSLSPAIDVGNETVNAITAPTTDIAGHVRQDTNGKRVAGCWDIMLPPVITDSLPADTTVTVGSSLVLRIAATGSAPLLYSWRQVGELTELSSEDSLAMTVDTSDDGIQLFCVVKNSVDSVWSDTTELHVLAPPVIVEHPDSLLAFTGDAITLRVGATGKPAPTYSWVKVGSATVLSTTDSLRLTDLTVTAGDIYRCYTTNVVGRDSVDITLIVSENTAPYFTVKPGSPVMVRSGDNYNLEVSVAGMAPITLTWYKNGLSAADSIGSGSIFEITGTSEADTGIYYCIAMNTFGSDTAGPIQFRISTANVFNLLQFTAQKVDPTGVRVFISNFRNLPATAGTEPWVDSVGIWYDYVTFPAAPLSSVSTSCVKISLQQMLASASDTFSTIIPVPLSEACATPLYLVTAPIWNNPEIIPQAITASQRATVAMCSTDIHENLLVLDVVYAPVTDSITLSVSNISSINPDSLMYLLIEYRKGTGTYATNPTIKIAAENLPVAGAMVLRSIHDIAFTGVEDSVRVRVRWRSISGNFSVGISRVVTVGKPHPVNTAVLVAESSTMDSIYLHWTYSTPVHVDSCRVWWSRQQLPVDEDVNSATASFVTLSAGIQEFALSDLLSATRYYIGVQLFSDGVGSFIPVSAQDTMTTQSFTTSLPNTIKLTELTFDSSTNTFNVMWDVDTSAIGPVAEFQTGILWDIDKAPNTAGLTENSFAVIASDLEKTDNSAAISPGNRLLFSRTYYFTLLLRRKGEFAWTVATDSSTGSVTTTPPSHQVVSYFMNNQQRVTVFNDQLQIRKLGEGIVNVLDDTVRVFNPPDTNGFIVASIGVDFARDANTDPVGIGIRYDTARIAGYPQSALRMYQFNADYGTWHLLKETTIDSVELKMVHFTCRMSKYRDPFIVMIDTLQPQVMLLSNTDEPVSVAFDVYDTLRVQDNVVNSSVGMYFWNTYETGSATVVPVQCDRMVDTVIIRIPRDSIISDWGVKAKLVISDGRFSVERDISRSASRSISDPVVLSAETWTPVFTTAHLADSSAKSALGELSPVTPWTYDSTLFQIYRWYSDNQTNVSPTLEIDATSKWIRYSESTSALFTVTPGKVLWVKALYATSIKSLGNGVTVSLKNDYTIPLQAKQWTDVALPFKFDIAVGDVVTATTAQGVNIWDNLYIYKWQYPESIGNNKSQLTTMAKFMAPIPGLNDSAAFLRCTSGEDGFGTYTILNLSQNNVDLHIPPVPAGYSHFTASALKKQCAPKRKNNGWSVAVHATARDGALAPVYCGFTPGTGTSGYPLAPTLQQQRVTVLHPQSGTMYGHLLHHEQSENGYCYRLEFVNNGYEPTRFCCTAKAATVLPEEFKVGMYNPLKKTVEYALDRIDIPVAGTSHTGRWLVVGDTAFIAAWQGTMATSLMELKAFPNPCRGELSVQYTIPDADIRQLKIDLFNQLGRRVWHRELGCRFFTVGSNILRFNPAHAVLGAGTYILRITAINNNRSVFGSRQKRILLIP